MEVKCSVKEKSIKINMILNGINGLFSVLFPLITFPYVSKILGVENIGKYNFADSIINYFVLLAGLGIGTYAIREGAEIREDQEKMNIFSKEIFTINILSTIVSCLLLFLLVLLVPKFENYTILLFILSFQILFKTIGIEWIYSIYEDYKYITIRSILFHLFSLILLFLFVHSENDLYIYTIIVVISNVGANMINFIHSRKYCHITITKKSHLKKHMKPILLLFATTVAITIYVNSDITILGFLTNDSSVGFYSVSTKVYTIIKSLLSSIVLVSIPRFSAFLAQNKKEEFKSTAEDIYKTLLTFVIPSVIGIIVLRREIILMISNDTYLPASSSLAFLSIAIFVCLGAYFWGQAMLVPLRQEKKVLKITIISAIVNIVLNVLFIPFWKENAAAITTIIAETIAFLYCKHETNKIIKLGKFYPIFVKSLIGSVPIIIVELAINHFISNVFVSTILVIFISVLVYIFMEVLLKNEIIIYYFHKGRERLNKFFSWGQRKNL